MRDETRGEETRRSDGQSEFLRGQLRQWLEQVHTSGKTQDLFELEMWLRSFERFFRIRNQPLSEKEAKQLALRNWSEELRLVDNVILRVAQLCTAILTEEQVNQTRFDQYVGGHLKRDELVDPYIERLMRQATPEAGLTLLREAFEDAHLLLADLVKLSRIRYATFAAVGRVLYREIRRSHLIALLIDKKFKPIHDRIANPAIAAIVRRVDDPLERKQGRQGLPGAVPAAALPDLRRPESARRGEPQEHDPDLLADHLRDASAAELHRTARDRRRIGPDRPLSTRSTTRSSTACRSSSRRSSTRSCSTSRSSRQADNIRARVENSHGILRDCFQQSVVQLAQALEPEIRGEDVFPDFTAKLDQSVRLRDGLARLIGAVRELLRREGRGLGRSA